MRETDPLFESIRRAGEVPTPPDRLGARRRAITAIRPQATRLGGKLVALAAAAALSVPAGMVAVSSRDSGDRPPPVTAEQPDADEASKESESSSEGRRAREVEDEREGDERDNAREDIEPEGDESDEREDAEREGDEREGDEREDDGDDEPEDEDDESEDD